jgi:phosphoenolpyruvate-protein kinase (PTS system EI component)
MYIRKNHHLALYILTIFLAAGNPTGANANTHLRPNYTANTRVADKIGQAISMRPVDTIRDFTKTSSSGSVSKALQTFFGDGTSPAITARGNAAFVSSYSANDIVRNIAHDEIDAEIDQLQHLITDIKTGAAALPVETELSAHLGRYQKLALEYYKSARTRAGLIKNCTSIVSFLVNSDIKKAQAMGQPEMASALIALEKILEGYIVFAQPLVPESMRSELAPTEFERIKSEEALKDWNRFEMIVTQQGKMYVDLSEQQEAHVDTIRKKIEALQLRIADLEIRMADKSVTERQAILLRVDSNKRMIESLMEEKDKASAMASVYTVYFTMLEDLKLRSVKNADYLAEQNLTSAHIVYAKWRAFNQLATQRLRKEGPDKMYALLLEGVKLCDDVLGHIYETEPFHVHAVEEQDDIVLCANGEIAFSALSILAQQYRIKGIVSLDGTISAHWVLLAAQHNIPVVIIRNMPQGISKIEDMVGTGDPVIINTSINAGESYVIVNPDRKSDLAYFIASRRQELERNFYLRSALSSTLPRQGPAIGIYGNISSSADIADIMRNGGKGVGLARTEVSLAQHATQLKAWIEAAALDINSTEANAHQAIFLQEYSEDMLSYFKAFDGMNGPITIRTFDIEEDKNKEILESMPEQQRATGFDFYRTNIGKQVLIMQLAAILYASYAYDTQNEDIDLRVMFPMVKSDSDLQWIWSEVLPEVKKRVQDMLENNFGHGLTDDFHNTFESVTWGAMVENIEAVQNIDEIVADPMIRFISIGNNDLTGSVLSQVFGIPISRDDKHFGKFFFELMPSVLEHVEKVAQAISAYNAEHPDNEKWMGSCGAIAGKETYVLFKLFLLYKYNIPGYVSVPPDMMPIMEYFRRHVDEGHIKIFDRGIGFRTDNDAARAVSSIYAAVKALPEYREAVEKKIREEARLFGIPTVSSPSVSDDMRNIHQAVSAAA